MKFHGEISSWKDKLVGKRFAISNGKHVSRVEVPCACVLSCYLVGVTSMDRSTCSSSFFILQFEAVLVPELMKGCELLPLKHKKLACRAIVQ
jgi:hypothetical protein